MIESPTTASDWQHRLQLLDQLLQQFELLWRPQPFKERRPEWCLQYPELSAALLQLDDSELEGFNSHPDSLLPWLSRYLPQLDSLQQLTGLVELSNNRKTVVENRFFDSVPGRKREQIKAFTGTIGEVALPLLEWCGGKGFLGRLLGFVWQQPVTTLEWDAILCRAGEKLSQRSQVEQKFYVQDVLQPELPVILSNKHAVALHACGGLHRQLIRRGVSEHSEMLDIAPCCYAVGVTDCYLPFCDFTQLQLCRDDLRLAVTETVTAGRGEIRQRDIEMAWKLGFNRLRADLSGNTEYQPLKPIPKAWLKLGFSQYCRSLAIREGLELPGDVDWQSYQEHGLMRQREVMRLLLVRHAFRRAIELWLVLDMVCWLEQQGYRVRLGTFCERELTPRNIMISARREL